MIYLIRKKLAEDYNSFSSIFRTTVTNSSFYKISQISRGARDSKIGKKWPESSRILDYILS